MRLLVELCFELWMAGEQQQAFLENLREKASCE
jgi:glycine cleavage system aminomethyltransferase T